MNENTINIFTEILNLESEDLDKHDNQAEKVTQPEPLSEDRFRQAIHEIQKMSSIWQNDVDVLLKNLLSEDNSKEGLQQIEKFFILEKTFSYIHKQIMPQLNAFIKKGNYSGELQEKVSYLNIFFHDVGNAIGNTVMAAGLLEDIWNENKFIIDLYNKSLNEIAETLSAFNIEDFSISYQAEDISTVLNGIRKLINRENQGKSGRYIEETIIDDRTFGDDEERYNPLSHLNFPAFSRVFLNILQNLDKAYLLRSQYEGKTVEEIDQETPVKLEIKIHITNGEVSIAFDDFGVGFFRGDEQAWLQKLEQDVFTSNVDGKQYATFIPEAGMTDWDGAAQGHGIGLAGLYESLNNQEYGLSMLCGTTIGKDGMPAGAHIELHAQLVTKS